LPERFGLEGLAPLGLRFLIYLGPCAEQAQLTGSGIGTSGIGSRLNQKEKLELKVIVYSLVFQELLKSRCEL
jgi:hypothetical protein